MRLCPSIRAFALASLSVLALLVAPARSQCLPDGLDGGPCCTPTFPNLPNFPLMQQQGTRFICFDKCAVAANIALCARIGVPVPKQQGGAFVCGAYDIGVRIKQCGVMNQLWNGKLNAFYSRNWQEFAPGGAVYTVWRFTVNGDFTPGPQLPTNPLYRPACVNALQVCYFTGYIDYAFDCINNTWSVAWMISHECDGVHHAPGTARPAPGTGYHPTRSFTFVGPSAGFVVSSTNPLISNGPIIQTAVRRNNWAAPMICEYEEPATGNFNAIADFCQCASAGPGQYNFVALNANGSCGTTIVPSALGPLNQKRLGAWTNPAVFPGPETLLFDFGWLDYTDACTGATTPEWFEGAETIGGYPAVEFTGIGLGRQFEDLASCNTPLPPVSPLIGAPHIVNYILNFNMP